MNPLILTLLNAHLESESERMQLVRRQNEASQNASLDRWRAKNKIDNNASKVQRRSINHETRIQNRKNPTECR